MFPIRDDNPHFLTPYATFGLIAANVAAWILVQRVGTEPALSASVFNLGLVPATGAWHSYLSSMFLHGGWLHLIGNMWFLWIFGNNVEDAMGHVRFVVFYLLCGVAAAFAQVAADPDSTIPMVGASGAIGGVMGAYVLLYPRVHVHLLVFLGFYATTFAVPAVFMLGYWFLLQLVSGAATTGAQGGVAFWAHAGGFIAGAILVFVFRNRRLLEQHPYWGWSRREAPTRNWRRVRR